MPFWDRLLLGNGVWVCEGNKVARIGFALTACTLFAWMHVTLQMRPSNGNYIQMSQKVWMTGHFGWR